MWARQAERPRVRVSPAAPALWAAFIWFSSPATLLTVLQAALLHELGHCLALRRMGVAVEEVAVTVFGVEMRTGDVSRLSYGKEIAAVLAGPAVNLLLAALLGAAGTLCPALYPLAGSHLILGAFNLLPARPLDGGRLLWLIAAYLTHPDAADRIARWVGCCVCAVLTAGLAVPVFCRGGSPFLLVAAAGLLAACVRELGLAKRCGTG